MCRQCPFERCMCRPRSSPALSSMFEMIFVKEPDVHGLRSISQSVRSWMPVLVS